MSTPDLPALVSSVARITMRVASTWSTIAGAARGDRGARVARDRRLHAGADERRLGLHERHRLALHVRAHQRAVGVVVLQERDERGGDRDELLGRDVHDVDLLARHHQNSPASRPTIRSSVSVPSVVHRRVGLRDVYFASSIADR